MGLVDYRGSQVGIWCMRDKVKAAEIAKYYFPSQFEANKSNYVSPRLKKFICWSSENKFTSNTGNIYDASSLFLDKW